jgi:hypothetical protein
MYMRSATRKMEISALGHACVAETIAIWSVALLNTSSSNISHSALFGTQIAEGKCGTGGLGVVDAVNKLYPGRAAMSAHLDLLITLLSWGAAGWKKVQAAQVLCVSMIGVWQWQRVCFFDGGLQQRHWPSGAIW